MVVALITTVAFVIYAIRPNNAETPVTIDNGVNGLGDREEKQEVENRQGGFDISLIRVNERTENSGDATGSSLGGDLLVALVVCVTLVVLVMIGLGTCFCWRAGCFERKETRRSGKEGRKDLEMSTFKVTSEESMEEKMQRMMLNVLEKTEQGKVKRKVDQEVPEKVLALMDESQKVEEVVGNIDSLDRKAIVDMEQYNMNRKIAIRYMYG